jgi:VCBS repeat-containing protein
MSTTPVNNATLAASPHAGVGSAIAAGHAGAAAAGAAVAGQVAADAALASAIAKGYVPARQLQGKVVGLWGEAIVRTAEGEVHPLKVGDIVKKGDVVLTSQDGIVQLEGPDAVASDDNINRVISEFNGDHDPTAAGPTAPTEGDALLPGLRVDRVVELVAPATIASQGPESGLTQTTSPLATPPQLLPGQAEPDSITLPENTSQQFDPRANDFGGAPGSTILTVAGQPIAVGTPVNLPQGTVSLNPDGTLTFLPTPNFNGTFTFNYSDQNGGVTSSSTVTVNVTPVDQPPVIGTIEGPNGNPVADPNVDPATGNYERTTPENTPVSGVVKATDPDSPTLTFSKASDPAHGTVTVNPDGTWTYIPNPDYLGNDSFTVTVSDGSGGTDTGTVDITVTPVFDTPAASNDAAVTPENTPVVIDVLANDTDADGRALTITEVNGKPVTVGGSPVEVTDASGNPIGAVLLTADGKLQFTPVADYSGPAVFTYTASDGLTPVQATVSVDVTPVNSPPVANPDSVTTPQDTPVTISVLSNDTDAEHNPLTITDINGQPVVAGTPIGLTDGAGTPIGQLTLNADGTLLFVPAAGYTGPADFTYTISDGQGGTSTTDVTVNVGATNLPPQANPDVGTTNEDTALVVSAANGVILGAPGADTDPNGDSLGVVGVAFGATQGAVGTPLAGAWGTLTLNADGSYTYVPSAAAQALGTGQSQTDVFTYTVSDPAGLTSTTTLTLTVTGVNDAPVAIDDFATTPENTPVVVPVLANDTDAEGNPLTVTQINGEPINASTPVTLSDSVGVPIGVVSLNTDGTLTFTPASGYTGPVDFKYTVSDGQATDEGNVHIAVAGDPAPPVAQDNFVTGIEDTVLTFDPRSNDSDPNGYPLSIVAINGQPISVSSPVTLTQGVVSLNADGTLTFTPAANYNGTFDFGYTDSNGHGDTVSAVVHVDITPVNDAPVANPDFATTLENTPVTLTVLGNDTDVENDPLTITQINGQPTGSPVQVTDTSGAVLGSVTLNANGTLTFDPTTGYSGVAKFNYTITDGNGGFSTTTVTVDVGAVNFPPQANPDVGITNEDTPLVVSAANGVILGAPGADTDPNGDTLTVTDVKFGSTDGAVGTPLAGAWGSLTLNADGSYTYTPNAAAQALTTGQNVTDVFTYTVTDAGGLTSSTTLTLTVNGINDAPIANPDVGVTNEDTPLVVSAADGVILGAPGADFDAEGKDLTVTGVSFGSTAGAVGAPLSGTWGTLTLNPDGSYSYTPNAAAQALTTGQNVTDVFTYTITDAGGLTSSTTLTLTVNGINDAPIANPDVGVTNEDTPLVVSAADGVILGAPGADFDAEGKDLTVTGVSFGSTAGAVGAPLSGTWGTLTLNPDGSYSYTPNAAAQTLNNGDSRQDVFTYTVTDAGGLTSSTTLTLTVNGIDDAPVVTTPPESRIATGQEDTPVILTWDNFGVTDVDSPLSALTVKITSLPANGVLQFFDGTQWTSVAVSQVISHDAIAAGDLRLVPGLNESGFHAYGGSGVGNLQYDYATFGFAPSDGQLDGTASTVVVDITPVADTPILTIDPVKTYGVAEDFQDINLPQAGYAFVPATTLNDVGGTVWRSDNGLAAGDNSGSGNVEVGHLSLYQTFTVDPKSTQVIELAATPGDKGNLYTTIPNVEAGEVYNLSFNYAARTGEGVGGPAQIDSTIYVYWEGQLLTTLNPTTNTLSNSFNLNLVASDVTGPNAGKLEFIAQDSSSYGGVLDNISLGLLSSTGVHGYQVNLPGFSGALTDTDGSETLSLSVGLIPVGSTLTDGINSFTSSAGATSADVTTWDLNHLALVPAAGVNGTVSLSYTATSTELDGVGSTATASTTQNVDVTVLPDSSGELYGTAGNDALVGTATDGQTLWGLDGNDKLIAGNGKFDALIGGAGNDTLTAGSGSDNLSGGTGNDVLLGGTGNDTLAGGLGNDTMTGGGGTDVFVWHLTDIVQGEVGANKAVDTITDFTAASGSSGGDVLDLRDLLQGETSANLGNYLNFDTTSQPGSTVIHISSTGQFTNGTYNPAVEDQEIVLSNVNLNPTGMSNINVINGLINEHKLIVDTVAHS